MTKSASIMIVFIILVLASSSAIVFGATHVIVEDFEYTWVDVVGTPSAHVVNADTIINTNTGSKQYYEHALIGSNNNVKVMVKQWMLANNPSVDSGGRFGTGSSTIGASGISPYYTLAGLRYSVPESSNSLAITIDYLNERDTGSNLTLIIQNVVAGVVEWESAVALAGFKSWAPGLQSLSLNSTFLNRWVQGREFNTVWIVACGITGISQNSSYFDNISITTTTPEEIIVVAEEVVIVEEAIVVEIAIEETIVVVSTEEVIVPSEEDTFEMMVVDAASDIEYDCPKEAKWKNHGAYVSCVAKAVKRLKYTYSNEVVTAAQSNIGKK